MWFMYLLSWLALFIQVIFMTIGIAAGLYYVAELVEEYTVTSKKVITWMTIVVLIVYILLTIFEDLSFHMILCGILSQIAHLFILNSFPFVEILSPSFVLGVVLFFVNHYLAFTFFTVTSYSFSETIGYFTVCLWLVPFALFVSLSANDNVLPTVSNSSVPESDSVLGSYLSKKGKKYGLLSLFHYAHEYVLPQRSKKMF